MAHHESNKEYFQKTCDMLVVGGYFRARLDSLDPFDKVVGGLVWAITATNAELDVDVFFEENASLGERIKIGEAIEKALVSMKCPYRLRAHEVQQQSYEPIFNAVQWLVKKVIDYRRTAGNLARDYSVLKYDQIFDKDKFATAMKPKGADYIMGIESKYTPNRRYRKDPKKEYDSNVHFVDATLLEYGVRFNSAARAKLTGAVDGEKGAKGGDGRGRGSSVAAKGARLANAFNLKPAKTKETSDKETTEDEEEEKNVEASLNALQENLLGIKSTKTQVSKQEFSSIVGMDAENISSIKENYETNKTSMAENIDLNASKAFVYTKQLENLTNQVKNLETLCKASFEVYSKVEEKASAKEEELQEQRELKQKLEEGMKKLEQKETSSGTDKALLDKLKGLVIENERLKAQEKEYRAQCLAQKSEVEERIAELKKGPSPEEARRLKKINTMFEAQQIKYNKGRQLVAKKNQELAKLERKMASIPFRAELIQYERRFVELYENVSYTLSETKKFFSMYNMLQEVHDAQEKQLNLLKNIKDTFSPSSSAETRHKFQSNFKNIVDSVAKLNQHHDMKTTNEKATFDHLTDKENGLLNAQRKYYQAVQEFQKACNQNERLEIILSTKKNR